MKIDPALKVGCIVEHIRQMLRRNFKSCDLIVGISGRMVVKQFRIAHEKINIPPALDALGCYHWQG